MGYILRNTDKYINIKHRNIITGVNCSKRQFIKILKQRNDNMSFSNLHILIL